jgi:tetratricopeptide (TPR) repeat protein
MQVSRNDTRRSSVEDLLAEGLELYGQNKVAEAVLRWREVLAVAPGEQRALDYLDAAGAEAMPAPTTGVVIELSAAREARSATPPSIAPDAIGEADVGAVDREALERLLQDKRYEEALAFLYKARDRAPQDPSLSRGIRALKEHLVVCYDRELGSHDRVPVRALSNEALAKIPPEQRQVLRLIDGLATFGDVLDSSRLGRFETSRLLASMLKRGSITVRAPSVTMAAVREPAPPAPPTRPSPSDPRSPEPPSEPRSSEPRSSEPPPSDYARAFDRATEAYLSHDYEDAARLYEECLAVRPGDARAEHNLRKVRALLGQ